MQKNEAEEYAKKLEILKKESKEEFWYIAGRIDEVFDRKNKKRKVCDS
ncbi:hypothetical protein [Romboutsia sp. 1001713B170131_170501_G6]|nr:hypothetical protein [Romboutsia sp. 1001713B170131_170501_G6]